MCIYVNDQEGMERALGCWQSLLEIYCACKVEDGAGRCERQFQDKARHMILIDDVTEFEASHMIQMRTALNLRIPASIRTLFSTRLRI